VLAALIPLLYFGSPEIIKQRYRSSLDFNDPNTANRIELFQTSIRLIRDNPWLGVGPKNVNQEALRYRGNNEFPNWLYQHMHNDFTQVAAERGIPGLLLWLWLMGRLAWDALRVYRSARKNPAENEGPMVISTAALGAWAALLAAGMFEWNFGDSEPLTLFLFMVAAPYAIRVAGKPETVAISEGWGKKTGSQD
jgi:O-antigen ligase